VKGFIFDENIPRRLTFKPNLPVYHVADMGESLTDTQIWEHAKKHELAIISKDTDFSNRMLVSQPPPWVVHLRVGNMRRKDFHHFLETIWASLEVSLPKSKIINVYPNRIESIQF
jgi:predicted nuclease of predicted toxin-antitoxin system